MKSLDTMTRDERNLLLFFETQAVDHGGLVDLKQRRGQVGIMNKEDFDIAKKWNEEGFVKFGRIKFHSIIEATHWCELSDEAWGIAHAERKARCTRIMSEQTIDKTCDR